MCRSVFVKKKGFWEEITILHRNKIEEYTKLNKKKNRTAIISFCDTNKTKTSHAEIILVWWIVTAEINFSISEKEN